jgi:excinuclease UvrABC helicase subunit UvrB
VNLQRQPSCLLRLRRCRARYPQAKCPGGKSATSQFLETILLLTSDNQAELDNYITKLESALREAAKKFEFEKDAKLCDLVKELPTKEFLFN